MNNLLKSVLWQQFGATIDMLENAIVACPENIWDNKSQFWYISYHTLFYLDYYLSEKPEDFSPPSPFTLSEFDPSGILPDLVYTKEELLSYLQFGRQKCHHLINSLKPQLAEQRFVNKNKDYSILEILLYNIRHVQHHVGQLNMLLRQGIDDAPKWVSRTALKL